MEKVAQLLSAIRECVDAGRYLDTRHATDRKAERSITRAEILYVLKHGHHEKRKDKFEQRFQAWNYAVRGKTMDARELRVIVSFDENNMLIITAIDLDL